MEHELPKVLDVVDEPVTVEELEQVVRRAGQRRRASVVAGAAALLSVGAIGGALARGPADDGVATGGYAAGPSDTAPPMPPQRSEIAMSPGFAAGGPGQDLKPLFRRESSGVAIRAYIVSWSAKEPTTIDQACAPPDSVNGQLSNGAAVTFAMVPLPRPTEPAAGAKVSVLGTGVFGRDEGEAATWVIVKAAEVNKVRISAGGASDTMEPIEGIALLTLSGAVTPTIEGLDDTGKVLTTGSVSEPPPLFMDPKCMPPPPCIVDAPPPPMDADKAEEIKALKTKVLQARPQQVDQGEVKPSEGAACHGVDLPAPQPTVVEGAPVPSSTPPAGLAP